MTPLLLMEYGLAVSFVLLLNGLVLGILIGWMRMTRIRQYGEAARSAAERPRGERVL